MEQVNPRAQNCEGDKGIQGTVDATREANPVPSETTAVPVVRFKLFGTVSPMELHEKAIDVVLTPHVLPPAIWLTPHTVWAMRRI